MKLLRRQVLLLAAGAATLSVASRTAGAQTYPSRPITMVVPFAAGGPADVVGRIIAERMRASLGQPIIIENVTGAAGTIGTGRVARASPDGYTLSIGPGSSTHVINGAIYTLPYDVLNDFEPIALLSNIPHIIVANKAVPADDLKGLIGWLKANPDSASQGTSGVGSVGHIVGVFFQKETGTRFYFVPYRGLAPAMQDLLAGRVDMMIDLPLNSLPHVRAGTIKAYAVTARTRLAAAPDIPTVDQAGLPGFYSSTWYSIYAPRRTSKDIVGKLNAAVVDVLADPAMRSRFIELGHEIVPREQQTPEALGDLQKAEIEKWWSILKTANIKGE
ncbi:tripartite tricarboxylate transporter substrate-binding protein [Bradyrhizobium sp.]|jgi:tripartite-type tricarboxylate transporter receptor subunit TctC|uniref:tripartite tricarboxylate transporter substrate-binding protein n=1 Tax=Bradyrhizobium sp. TaxID=376 RepID=UPI002CFAA3B5|nr:tripartite tricarboxylate transporter substrate-binding protein [Bradyrhizobium sp.]HWX61712.1 tripartite tricarboxylate transporter substrate-binding protein [Bradyrhizobium sp.]